MSDLAAFIAARLDEDEAMAKAADVRQHDPEWWPSARQGDRIAGIHGSTTIRSKRDSRPIARVQSCGDEEDPAAITDGEAVAAHIARHDPARALREVAAMRAILDGWKLASEGMHSAEYLKTLWLYRAVCAIAAVWSDHGDYRADWAPATRGDG